MQKPAHRAGIPLHGTGRGIVLPANLSRYAAVATLLLKHRSDLLASTAWPVPPPISRAPNSRTPSAWPRISKSSGRRSSSSDSSCPRAPICCLRRTWKRLSRLQDDVDPVPLADVQKTIEDELGVRLSKGFSTFDERAAGVRVARTGPSRRAARREAGRRQGATARHRRAGKGGPERPRRDCRIRRSAHEGRPPVRVCSDDRRVPQGADGRARLQRRGEPSPDTRSQHGRVRADRRAASRRRLRQHSACSPWITSAARRSRRSIPLR